MIRFFNRKLFYYCTFLLLLILTFLSFRFNTFKVVDSYWFENHQLDSDRLVVDKLVAGTLGIGNSYFLGRIRGTEEEILRSDLLLRYSSEKFKGFQPYHSQFGFSQFIFRPFWDSMIKIFKSDPNRFVYAFEMIKTVISVINALILSLFFFWIWLEFPKRVFLLFLIPSFLYPEWTVVFGKSVYWQMWTWFAPFVFNLYFLKKIFGTKKCMASTDYLFMGIINFFLIYLKCLMGYEYISTILIASILPFIYYSVKNNQLGICKLIPVFFTIGVCAFLFALGTHYLLLYWEVNNPGDILKEIISKRTHNFGELSSIPEVYHKGLTSSVWEVIVKYLFEGSNYIKNQCSLLILCLLSIIYSWRMNLFSKDRKFLALSVTMVISILGPLSWYILAKGHSHIHTHMNYVLWYLPLNYLIYLFLTYIFVHVLKSFLRKETHPLGVCKK